MRMIGFSGENTSQNQDELRKFIRILQAAHVTSYLEIGARHGDTFHQIMLSLSEGSRGVAVDLPDAQWGMVGSEDALLRCTRDLNERGYFVEAIFGDSHSDVVRNEVERHGPYDACLIDADHRFAPAAQDFLAYAVMAKLVALHDIDGHGVRSHRSGEPIEIPKLWKLARISAGVGRSKAIIGKKRGMGIGVMWMREGQRPLA
jgi:hypothetical protein